MSPVCPPGPYRQPNFGCNATQHPPQQSHNPLCRRSEAGTTPLPANRQALDQRHALNADHNEANNKVPLIRLNYVRKSTLREVNLQEIILQKKVVHMYVDFCVCISDWHVKMSTDTNTHVLWIVV